MDKNTIESIAWHCIGKSVDDATRFVKENGWEVELVSIGQPIVFQEPCRKVFLFGSEGLVKTAKIG